MKKEIVEGLKMALIKGESLQQAMQSFYNAGYSKEEIESAARELQSSGLEMSQKPQDFQQQDKKKPIAFSQKTGAIPSQTPQNNKSMQKVSNYEDEETRKNPRATLIITISILLVLILAALTGIYFFRQEIVNYLTSLFG